MEASEHDPSQSPLYAMHTDSKRLLQKAAGVLDAEPSCADHAGQAASVLHRDTVMTMAPWFVSLGHAGAQRGAAVGDLGGPGEDRTCRRNGFRRRKKQ